MSLENFAWQHNDISERGRGGRDREDGLGLVGVCVGGGKSSLLTLEHIRLGVFFDDGSLATTERGNQLALK